MLAGLIILVLRDKPAYTDKPWLEALVSFAQNLVVLLGGFATFVLSHMTSEYVQPLLSCMMAGFVVVNYTSKRQQLSLLEDDVSPLLYMILFTLTGASVSLDTIPQSIVVVVILFAVRLAGIIIGAYVGGKV